MIPILTLEDVGNNHRRAETQCEEFPINPHKTNTGIIISWTNVIYLDISTTDIIFMLDEAIETGIALEMISQGFSQQFFTVTSFFLWLVLHWCSFCN